LRAAPSEPQRPRTTPVCPRTTQQRQRRGGAPAWGSLAHGACLEVFDPRRPHGASWRLQRARKGPRPLTQLSNLVLLRPCARAPSGCRMTSWRRLRAGRRRRTRHSSTARRSMQLSLLKVVRCRSCRHPFKIHLVPRTPLYRAWSCASRTSESRWTFPSRPSAHLSVSRTGLGGRTSRTSLLLTTCLAACPRTSLRPQPPPLLHSGRRPSKIRLLLTGLSGRGEKRGDGFIRSHRRCFQASWVLRVRPLRPVGRLLPR
jgi:hypothetical protein